MAHRWLCLSSWQEDVLRSQGIDVELVKRALGVDERQDEHCDCSAIPWPDHWHRRVL
jgi:hypothetical protein